MTTTHEPYWVTEARPLSAEENAHADHMTIREGKVFKVKREQVGGYATDMAARKFLWIISGAAKPRFAGTHDECLAYIAEQGAKYHALP